MRKKVDNKPYTYVAYYRGIPVYIGKGTGDRLNHTNSGQSNNELLNEFYFRARFLDDMPLVVHKVKRHICDFDALAHEKELISKYLPYCNKCSGRSHNSDYIFKGKLSKVCFENGYSQPEVLESKFDFRFLFTPKGLWCKSVKLSDKSPFEYAFNKYHIKIKDEILVHFKEFCLQFADLRYSEYLHNADDFGYAVVTKEHFERGGLLFGDLGFDKDWCVDAFKVGGFNNYHLAESTKKPKNEKLDLERHDYSNSVIHESHVNKHYWNTNQVHKIYRCAWDRDYKREIRLK